MSQNNSIKLIAPAKINLFLHVVGKKKDGYHLLQSLTSFSDFGDEITISPTDEFKFSFDSTAEHLPIDENNLIVCAANLLSNALGKDLNCHIHLSKNIPIGAGLGGGSSDAATTIRGLLKFWDATISPEQLSTILLSLGADVPACYQAQACYFEGIGEKITPLQSFPALPALLIYPNKHCSTQDVFNAHIKDFSEEIKLPPNFQTKNDLLNFLSTQKNDLEEVAVQNISDIKIILEALGQEKDCQLFRMSGSGSACFGIFDTTEKAHKAAHNIQKENKSWWVQPVTLA